MDNKDYLISFLLHNKNYAFNIDSKKILDLNLKELIETIQQKDTNDIVFLAACTNYSIETLQSYQKLDLTNIDFDKVINSIYLDYYKFLFSNSLLELNSVKDYDDLNQLVFKLQNLLDEAYIIQKNNENELLYNPKKIINEYNSKRKDFSKKRSFGLKELDDLCTNPLEPEEITILFGQRGIGKSAVLKNIEVFLLRNNVSVLSLNLEMSFRSLISRYFSIMTNIDFYKFSYNLVEENILKNVYEEFSKFKLRFSNSNFLTLFDLNKYIQNVQKEFDEEYIVVTIDSLDMIADFDSPDKIKRNMDRLHSIAKKNKVHIIGITQANENKIRYSKPKENYVFSKYDIYGSSYYSARARLVILVNRPNFINKELGLPYDLLEEDILQLKIVKQNDGDLGEVLYNFNPKTFKIGNAIKNYHMPIANFEIYEGGLV